MDLKRRSNLERFFHEYVYTCIYIHMYIYTYIYIYRERERARESAREREERDKERKRDSLPAPHLSPAAVGNRDLRFEDEMIEI